MDTGERSSTWEEWVTEEALHKERAPVNSGTWISNLTQNINFKDTVPEKRRGRAQKRDNGFRIRIIRNKN